MTYLRWLSPCIIYNFVRLANLRAVLASSGSKKTALFDRLLYMSHSHSHSHSHTRSRSQTTRKISSQYFSLAQARPRTQDLRSLSPNVYYDDHKRRRFVKLRTPLLSFAEEACLKPAHGLFGNASEDLIYAIRRVLRPVRILAARGDLLWMLENPCGGPERRPRVRASRAPPCGAARAKPPRKTTKRNVRRKWSFWVKTSCRKVLCRETMLLSCTQPASTVLASRRGDVCRLARVACVVALWAVRWPGNGAGHVCTHVVRAAAAVHMFASEQHPRVCGRGDKGLRG